MTQTKAGPVCDVCGNYILPIINKEVHIFRCDQFVNGLMADDKCIELIKNGLDDWHDLPDGPMKKALLEAELTMGD